MIGRNAQAHCNENLTYDIACDGRTIRFVRMDPAAVDQRVMRGDAFIVNGKICPGGTIEQGLNGPNQAGSIGTWICRGWIYVDDLTDPEQVPHTATTQHYLFDDGSGLVSDGLEGGIKTARAIVGGMGSWLGASGYVSQEMVEENDTLLDLGEADVSAPNFRFAFSLTSGN